MVLLYATVTDIRYWYRYVFFIFVNKLYLILKYTFRILFRIRNRYYEKPDPDP